MQAHSSPSRFLWRLAFALAVTLPLAVEASNSTAAQSQHFNNGVGSSSLCGRFFDLVSDEAGTPGAQIFAMQFSPATDTAYTSSERVIVATRLQDAAATILRPKNLEWEFTSGTIVFEDPKKGTLLYVVDNGANQISLFQVATRRARVVVNVKNLRTEGAALDVSVTRDRHILRFSDSSGVVWQCALNGYKDVTDSCRPIAKNLGALGPIILSANEKNLYLANREATDEVPLTVWRLNLQSRKLTVLYQQKASAAGPLVSVNGIVLNNEQTFLYITDLEVGLFRLELCSLRLSQLVVPKRIEAQSLRDLRFDEKGRGVLQTAARKLYTIERDFFLNNTCSRETRSK